MSEADVYSGDLNQLDERQEGGADFTFHIQAEAYPDVLSRVADEILLSNITRGAVSLCTQADGRISMEVRFSGISAAPAFRIVGKLSQLISVRDVGLEKQD
jgi:hypothetical protein